MSAAFMDGYYAGTIGNDKNPFGFWEPGFYAWKAGNAVGMEFHCLMVEGVILRFPQD